MEKYKHFNSLISSPRVKKHNKPNMCFENPIELAISSLRSAFLSYKRAEETLTKVCSVETSKLGVDIENYINDARAEYKYFGEISENFILKKLFLIREDIIDKTSILKKIDNQKEVFIIDWNTVAESLSNEVRNINDDRSAIEKMLNQPWKILTNKELQESVKTILDATEKGLEAKEEILIKKIKTIKDKIKSSINTTKLSRNTEKLINELNEYGKLVGKSGVQKSFRGQLESFFNSALNEMNAPNSFIEFIQKKGIGTVKKLKDGGLAIAIKPKQKEKLVEVMRDIGFDKIAKRIYTFATGAKDALRNTISFSKKIVKGAGVVVRLVFFCANLYKGYEEGKIVEALVSEILGFALGIAVGSVLAVLTAVALSTSIAALPVTAVIGVALGTGLVVYYLTETTIFKNAIANISKFIIETNKEMYQLSNSNELPSSILLRMGM